MKPITRGMTKDELEAWRLAFVASVEDGSLRAECEANSDPAWEAQYGDAAWEAALVVSGYGPLPEAVLRSRERRDRAQAAAEASEPEGSAHPDDDGRTVRRRAIQPGTATPDAPAVTTRRTLDAG